MATVFSNIFESNLLDSIADFVRSISNLKTAGISADMQEKIAHMAHTIIPDRSTQIEAMLDQLELCYADKVAKLRLDQEKLVMFQQKLNALLVMSRSKQES